MKKYIKYVLTTIGYCLVYMLMDYLFTKNIDFKLAIGSSIMYFIFNIVFFGRKSKND